MTATPSPAGPPGAELSCRIETTRAYAALTSDHNPLHVDADFAATTPFGVPIAHGTMALNLLLAAIERSLDPGLRIGDVEVRFVAPTPLPNRLTANAVPAAGGDETYDVAVARDDGTLVLTGTVTLVPRRPMGGRA